MRLTTKSRYGTRMILDIARNSSGKPVPISEIAKRQNISIKYLEKLIRKLKQGNIVKSQRGPFGGHMLQKPMDQITLGELVRILEDTTAITDCAEQDSKYCATCNLAGECATQWAWIEASTAMFERLDNITISELLEKCNQGKFF